MKCEMPTSLRVLRMKWGIEDTADLVYEIKYGRQSLTDKVIKEVIERNTHVVCPWCTTRGTPDEEPATSDAGMCQYHKMLWANAATGSDIVPAATSCFNEECPEVRLASDLAEIDKKHEPGIKGAKDRLAKLKIRSGQPSGMDQRFLRDAVMFANGSIIGGGTMLTIYHLLQTVWP